MNGIERKLLVVGAGIGQEPLVRKAKAMGVHVTVATRPGQPCVELADDVIYEDVFNVEAVVAAARQRHITAVTSDQNDLMMPTVAFVAEKLGLPGNTCEQVKSYCNKNIFRDNCDKLGIPVPLHCRVDDELFDTNTLPFGFPMMVKPADSQSSIGVKRVDTEMDFENALHAALNASRTHSAIVEEFFAGHEVVCEGLIEDGEYYPLALADRKYFDLDSLMIPCQTLFPSLIPEELQQEIVSRESKMAKYVKPSFAITHSEYLVDLKSGQIRVVESALRGGGVYISSDLIPLATGIDANEFLLRKALGEQVDIEEMMANRKSASAGYVCFYLPEGIVKKGLDVELINGLECVHKAYVGDITPGEKTEPMLHKGLRKGPILMKAENRVRLEEGIRLIQDTAHVSLEREGNYFDIRWV